MIKNRTVRGISSKMLNPFRWQTKENDFDLSVSAITNKAKHKMHKVKILMPFNGVTFNAIV